VGPVSPADAVLGAVLERWDFADVQGWVELLADALDEAPDRSIGDELRPKLARLADSPVRAALAAATELHRNVEFLADLAELSEARFKLRGVIDLLFRDSAGWHILAVDRGIALEDDPWRGRRPGLILQAWAATRQLGGWPASIALFDLATGQLVELDPQRLSLMTVAEHFLRAVKNAAG
jgi:hypothetical protein